MPTTLTAEHEIELRPRCYPDLDADQPRGGLFAPAAKGLALERTPRWTSDLDAIHRLRYEVYCLEQKFRDAADYPDGREQDEFDPHSIHVFARDTKGDVAGAVRLVRHSPLGLPVECHGPLSLATRDVPRRDWAEISRLVLARQYRRQTLEEPLLLWGLFGRMFEVSRREGIIYWIAAMEDSLWRLLRRFGFPFSPAGEPMDYFGHVVPYGATLDSLEPGYRKIRAFQARMAGSRPELADKFQLRVAA
jgi:N-acyl-L-homoserine lactone synthetase